MESSRFSSTLSNVSNLPASLPPIKKDCKVVPRQSAADVNLKTGNPIKVTVYAKNHKKSDPMCLLGPWTKHEHLAFLYGLRRFGPGRWKKIGELVPTRDNVQIKSHGQQVLKRSEKGFNIFDELDTYFYEQECQHSRFSSTRYTYRGQPHHAVPLWTTRAPLVAPPQAAAIPRLRPPTDVIDAASGLVELSMAPRHFTTFGKGPMEAIPRHVNKL